MVTTVTRVFDAPAIEMLPLLGRVLRERPYLLTLIGSAGGHPFAGGTLRFALPATTGHLSRGAFWGHLGTRAREITVAIEPLGEACEIRFSVVGRVPKGAVAELDSALRGIARSLLEETLLTPNATSR
jgi:hypothetical protein